MDSDGVARLEARLDRIEASLERVTRLLDALPPQLGMVMDAGDELAKRVSSRGVDVDARVAAALSALERLSEPKTLDALVRIAAQADRLEPVVAWAASAEGTVAMGIDAVDAVARRAAERGIDLDARARAALDLLERVSDPATAAAVGRLAALAPALEPVARLAAQFEDQLALVVDSADAWAAARQREGIDLDQRATDGFALLLRLASPDVVGPLGRLIDAVPALARHADKFPRQLDLASQILDHVERFAADTGRTTEQLVDDGALALVRLATLAPALFESGVLDAATLAALGRVGRELPLVLREEPAPVGFFGLLGAMSDPQVQRALGLALALARRSSQALLSSNVP
jgi:hypothetical protein